MKQPSRTMIYTVDLGDGRVVDIEGPEGATPDQLQGFVSENQASFQQPAAQGGAEPAQATAQPINEAPDQYVGGFADQQAPQAQSRLSAGDEAALQQLYRTGTMGQIQEFLHQRGRATSDVAGLANFIKARDAGAKVGTGVDYALPPVPVSSSAEAALRGADQGLTLKFADELAGVRDGVAATLSGGNFGDAYDSRVDQERALLGSDEANNFGASLAGELVGGFAIPVGLERAGLTATIRGVGMAAGRDALRSGVTLPEARAIAARAMTQRVAAEGAAYGGASGAGGSEGDLGERLGAGAVGAGVGAVAGTILGSLGNAAEARAIAGRTAARTPTEAQRVGAAAARQGVDVLPADVAGPTTRRLTSAAAQAPISAAPVINQSQRAVEQSAGVRDRVAAAFGTALNPEAAGERAIQGADAFIRRTSGRGGQLYTAAEQAAAGVTVTPTQALRVLNRNISELTDTPGGAVPLERLTALRQELQDNQFTVPGVRRMRSILRDEFIGEGIRGSDLERRVNQVIDAAADDVTTSLQAAGRGAAARQFRVADRYWRNRLSTIDDHLAPVIGKNGDASGEQVVQRLQMSAKGNNARLRGFLRALPPEEQGDVRATLISRLGRSTNGAQNDQGDAFSLQTFLTNWNEIGETAKTTLFGGETRAAMNDLATIASGARETAGYANRSNTAGAMWGNIGALLGLGSIAPQTAIAGLITQYGGGRLLASPRVARWFARPPSNPGGLPQYVARLSRIARAEPALAADINALQQRLSSALSGAPARVAAEERSDSPAVGDGQDGQQQPEQQGFEP